MNGPTPDPCGVCDSCVALAPSGPGSIDVIEIDAAWHGGVDDARDLRERAFYAPVAGRYKIYIIDEAHMVTQQGFNALLKLVEEPPPHLKFIFATTEPEKVIPTIRSRTHHYPFRLMPPSVMRELLEEILNSEGVPFDPAVMPLVVRAGAGSARDSLSILDQLLAGSDESGIRYDRAVALLGYTDASMLDEIVDAFAGRDGAAVFRAVNRVIEGGHEPRRFATDMLDRFRDLIVLASVPDAITTGLLDVPPDRAEALTAQASRSGLAALTRAAEIISTGLDQMRGATSPRLLLELMCAQVLLPTATTDERSLLARLERLEAGAANIVYAERVPLPPHNPPARQPGQPDGAASPAAVPPDADPVQAAPPQQSSRPQRADRRHRLPPPESRPRSAAPAAPTPAATAARRAHPRRRAARPPPTRCGRAGMACSTRSRPGAGRRDRHRQRERRLPRRGGAHPPLPAPGRREGLPEQQVRGPAQAGDHRDVRRQRRGPRRHRGGDPPPPGTAPALARAGPAGAVAASRHRHRRPAVRPRLLSRVRSAPRPGTAHRGRPRRAAARPARRGPAGERGASGGTDAAVRAAAMPPFPSRRRGFDPDDEDMSVATTDRAHRHGPGPARARRPDHRRIRGLTDRQSRDRARFG